MDSLDLENRAGPFEAYLSLRRTQRRINSELVKRFSRATIERSARRLGLWKRGMLVAESEEDFDVLCDFCIYDGFSEGKSAVARYRAERGSSHSSDAIAVLEAMSRGAPFSLFRIETVEPDTGARLLDLLTGEDARVFDQGLGATGRSGLYVGARLLHFPSHGVCMTTGAAIGADPDLARQLTDDIHVELDANTNHAREVVRRASHIERSRIAVRVLGELLATPID